MSSSSRQAIVDTLMTASGVLILVIALWAIDHRVRERASTMVGGGPPLASVADAGGRVVGFGETTFHIARAWSGAHVYLTIFAVAGVVLLAAVRRL